MQTRSRKVGMPNGLSLPLAFGMYTLLIGSGRYVSCLSASASSPSHRCTPYASMSAKSGSRLLPSLSRATPSAVSEHSSELIGCPIPRSLAASCVRLELRSLPSPGVTRLLRYCEPLRLPKPPGLSLAGVRLIILDHAFGPPVFRSLSLCTCCRHYPGAAAGRTTSLTRPAVSAFPERVVGSACASSFSRLARRSLALRPAHSRCHQFVTRIPTASAISSPPWLLRLLPAGAVAGWVLHPLESAAFSRRTPKLDIFVLALARRNTSSLPSMVAEGVVQAGILHHAPQRPNALCISPAPTPHMARRRLPSMTQTLVGRSAPPLERPVGAADEQEQPLHVAAFKGTPEEVERQWYEQVYRGHGDSMAQLTWRAVLIGSCLGGVLSLTNLYIGLKAGWGFGVAITAC